VIIGGASLSGGKGIIMGAVLGEEIWNAEELPHWGKTIGVTTISCHPNAINKCFYEFRLESFVAGFSLTGKSLQNLGAHGHPRARIGPLYAVFRPPHKQFEPAM
jgi:hypothetical protein